MNKFSIIEGNNFEIKNETNTCIVMKQLYSNKAFPQLYLAQNMIGIL